MCVRAAYYIYKGCTDAQHTYTFFWSAEEILLLRREKTFPLRSRKISSALKFSPRKDVCRSVGATYICGCSDRPTRIRQQTRVWLLCYSKLAKNVNLLILWHFGADSPTSVTGLRCVLDRPEAGDAADTSRPIVHRFRLVERACGGHAIEPIHCTIRC